MKIHENNSQPTHFFQVSGLPFCDPNISKLVATGGQAANPPLPVSARFCHSCCISEESRFG